MNLSEKLFDEFEHELAKSEYQRSAMLAGVFTLSIVIMSVSLHFAWSK